LTGLPVTFACGPYDRMEALARGIVRPDGIDLRYIAIQSPPEIFARMLKTRSFDVSEMSLAHYMVTRIRDRLPYIAIPVFPSRVFRHGYIFINRNAGIATPKDLEGRRVGVQEYRQTAAVWIRGILAHEYGVDLDSIDWVEGGVNVPRGADAEMDLRPTGPLSLSLIPGDATLNAMLEAGEIDAYLGARRPDALDGGRNVGRLFPDYRAAEAAFYRKTRMHPIMHTVVIREDLHAAEPWIADSLYRACTASRDWALEQMQYSGAQRLMLPWMYQQIAEMMEIFDGDPWPYGVEANRHALEAFAGFLAEQRFIDAAPPVDTLFTPLSGQG
jgi:4,5-dihydroxyphthalate decarboxylase